MGEEDQAKGKQLNRTKLAGGSHGHPHEREGLKYDACASSRALLDLIPEAREMLLPTLGLPRAEVRHRDDVILKEYPGHKRRDIYASRRRLRDDRGDARGRHAAWAEEDILELKAGYTQGPAGARRARKELSTRHADWSRHMVDYMAAKFELAAPRKRPKPWSSDERKALLWTAEEKPLEQIAARHKRSSSAVRFMLSANGARGKVRFPKAYTLRVGARMLGVSHTTLRRWLAQGLLPISGHNDDGASMGAITGAALRLFCRDHAERVNRERCARVVHGWLPQGVDAAESDRNRAHLVRQMTCPGCGRTIRGNGYYTHAKRCIFESQASGSNVYLSSAAVQLSSDG